MMLCAANWQNATCGSNKWKNRVGLFTESTAVCDLHTTKRREQLRRKREGEDKRVEDREQELHVVNYGKRETK